MRPLVNEFVEICASTLPVKGPIYEFGAYIVEGQEEIANIRRFFPEQAYIGADMREGPGVDRILNLHKLALDNESVSTVICMDTLEHVEFPWRAIEEMHRVLASDGLLIMSSVMNFPIHDYPSDYWRFTPEAFKSLLKPFPSVLVAYAGTDEFPHSVMAVASKQLLSADVIANLQNNLVSWKLKWLDSATTPSSRIIELEELVSRLEKHILHVETERDLHKARWTKLTSIAPIKWLLSVSGKSEN